MFVLCCIVEVMYQSLVW